MRIALVSCSATKLDRPAPAQELYSSPLFKKSRAWAERFCDRWAILSAKHGLVLPETLLLPYDVDVPSFPRAQYELWKRNAGEQITRTFGVLGPDDVLVFLASELYAGVSGHVAGSPRREQPMRTMQVGQRLRWLNEQLKGAG